MIDQETITGEEASSAGGTAQGIEEVYAAPAAMPAHEEPAGGAAILDETCDFLCRFLVPPSPEALDAMTLWAAGTHAYQAFNVWGRLALLSDEPAAGKTRGLDLLALLAARAEQVINATGYVLFTLIRETSPTLLMDEIDQVYGKSGRGARRSDMLSILNGGYKQGARVPRVIKGAVEWFPTFCPVAFAGLGRLPDMLMTRCIVIRMRKRRKGESCDTYQPRMHAPLGMAIGAALASWAVSVLPELASAWPAVPEAVQEDDRAAEIWEPMLAIGEVAGGSWPGRARRACEALVLGASGKPARAPSLQLLDDIALVWPDSAAKLPSAELVRLLMDVPGTERKWDPAAAPRELAAMLRPHGIEPVKIRQGERTMQGYMRDAFPALAAVRQETPAA